MGLFRFILLLFLLLPSQGHAAGVERNLAEEAKKPAEEYRPHGEPGGLVGKSYTAMPRYNFMARYALDKRSKHFDFTAFREAYSSKDDYDPLGVDVRDKMLTLAYEIAQEKDPKILDQKIAEYAELTAAHLANIDVVTQALTLSREDKRLGDASFYEWMRKGLIKSIMAAGDGTNLYHAYVVITMGEETALLAALGVEVVKSNNYESGGVYYNTHEVKDEKAPGPYVIFVDTTKPMMKLEQDKLEKGRFSIRGR
ncbi:MAG: DUF4919 domain-containing protein [Alphaproteobacteria bacterium]|nr:DUF4919 domain-containing protein [Alphaproteobacteria bacterium]